MLFFHGGEGKHPLPTQCAPTVKVPSPSIQPLFILIFSERFRQYHHVIVSQVKRTRYGNVFIHIVRVARVQCLRFFFFTHSRAAYFFCFFVFLLFVISSISGECQILDGVSRGSTGPFRPALIYKYR